MAHAHVDAQRAAPSETLAGTVERVTFHNAENGFAVLKVKTRGKRDLITVVGHAATISAGEFITASGSDTARAGRWHLDLAQSPRSLRG